MEKKAVFGLMEDPEDPFFPTPTSFLPFFDIKSDEGGEDVGCRGKTRPEASPPPLWQRDRSILIDFGKNVSLTTTTTITYIGNHNSQRQKQNVALTTKTLESEKKNVNRMFQYVNSLLLHSRGIFEVYHLSKEVALNA